MANYASDTFTDADSTDIVAHTPGAGGPWVDDEGTAHVQTNALQTADFVGFAAHVTATIPDDAVVSVDHTLGIPGASATGGVRFRFSSGGAPFYGYEAVWSDGPQQWELRVWTGFGYTGLGTYADSGYLTGTKHLELAGVSDALTVTIDGVLRISATDATYTSGVAGLRIESQPGGATVLDNFSVDDPGGGEPTPLTGSGSISVTGIVAVEVTLTSIPAFLRQAMGNPDRFFEIGNVSFGYGGFATRNHYLEHFSEIVAAPFANVDTVYYSFAPSAVATITPIYSF